MHNLVLCQGDNAMVIAEAKKEKYQEAEAGGGHINKYLNVCQVSPKLKVDLSKRRCRHINSDTSKSTYPHHVEAVGCCPSTSVDEVRTLEAMKSTNSEC